MNDVTCNTCGTRRFMEFECVDCCLRWLSGMDRETMKLNAPTIEVVAGSEHMEKVREEWKMRGHQSKDPDPFDGMSTDERVARYLSGWGR